MSIELESRRVLDAYANLSDTFGRMPRELSLSSSGSGAPRLTYLIKRVETLMGRRLDSVTKTVGLTVAQYATLSVLRQRPGISSAGLARRAFVTAQSMQVMVTYLVEKGYVERTADPGHGRVLRNFLTDEGSRLLDVCDQAASEVDAAMLKGLSAGHEALLREMLATIFENLREEAGQSSAKAAPASAKPDDTDVDQGDANSVPDPNDFR